MRTYLICAAAAALMSAPASAKSKSDTLHLPGAQPVKISVSLSDDLLHRADNLPEKRRDRGHTRGRNDGWGGNGFYGMRDLDRLKEEVAEELLEDFAKANIAVSETAGYELRVVLVDAKPTRPTFRQLSKQPGLSYQSLANGGAHLTAQILDSAGNVVSTTDYDWYENNLGDNFGMGTWSDANRAISRFARRTAKSLSK